MGSVMFLPKHQLFANFFQHLLIVRIKLCLRIRSRFFSVAKDGKSVTEFIGKTSSQVGTEDMS
jgi:hypothetical protein